MNKPVDIDGLELKVGDIVECTPERAKVYRGSSIQIGDRLRIDEIYMMEQYPDEPMGHLYLVDGSGSVFNSSLKMYRKVNT